MAWDVSGGRPSWQAALQTPPDSGEQEMWLLYSVSDSNWTAEHKPLLLQYLTRQGEPEQCNVNSDVIPGLQQREHCQQNEITLAQRAEK